jgi:hypothetical protein
MFRSFVDLYVDVTLTTAPAPGRKKKVFFQNNPLDNAFFLD